MQATRYPDKILPVFEYFRNLVVIPGSRLSDELKQTMLAFELERSFTERLDVLF